MDARPRGRSRPSNAASIWIASLSFWRNGRQRSGSDIDLCLDAPAMGLAELLELGEIMEGRLGIKFNFIEYQ